MQLNEVLLVLLSGLGVFHGVLFAFILWSTRSAMSLPNRLLSSLLLVLSLRVGKSVALAFSNSLDIIYIYLGLCLLLLIGPLYYLYCRTLIRKENKLSKSHLAHFIPALIGCALSIPFQLTGFRNLPDVVTVLLFFIFYGHFLGYLLFVRLRLLGPHNTAALTGVSRNWLDILFYGLILVWIVYVLNLFEDRVPYIIGPIVYSGVVYFITYLAISGKYFQAGNTLKYSTTSMSAQEIDILFERIETAMGEEKLFLEPDLTLAFLAKRLQASPQKVSLTINSKAACNFNEYVNRFRIAHAIELLNKPETRSLTIAAIGTESGFNSLSSFNLAFRKIAGTTPSVYRKEAS